MKIEIKGLVKFTKPEMTCGCYNLHVKGKEASLYDFGEMTDFAPTDAPDYGCGDRGFAPAPETPEVLKKYDITYDEYNKICACLETNLHIGLCGLCQ